jgi:bis(5'-nucleosyl)-tetraphosphatase (symmetrical)
VTTYAIGDVQGCYDTLRRLLDRVRFEPARDVLWFVGDLVNRGTGSLQVLRFVRSLDGGAVTVLGNHDLHLLAIARGHRPARRGDTLDRVLQAPDRDELLDWLRRRPLMHRDDRLGFVMTHAGVPHIWTLDVAAERAREVEQALTGDAYDDLLASMYGNKPARWRDQLTGVERWRVIINYLTRMRLIDAVGRLELRYSEGLDGIPKGFQPWFEFYRSRPSTHAMVFGHWAALNGECSVEGIYPLDTGCVWGNSLTALALRPLERISVTSVENWQ